MNPKRLLYIFVAFAVSLIFLILGFFAVTPKDITVSDTGLPANKPEPSECVGELCDTDEPSFSGTVREAEGGSSYTHLLENNAGETVAYLKTDDDKLKMVEGMTVTITGKTTQIINNIPQVQVSGVKF
ncbi:MAG: hypothetical protein ABH814_03120 [bacterium]